MYGNFLRLYGDSKAHAMELVSNRVEGKMGYFDAKGRIERSSFLANLLIQKSTVKSSHLRPSIKITRTQKSSVLAKLQAQDYTVIKKKYAFK